MRVRFPAQLAADASRAAPPETIAWRCGRLACLGAGLIEVSGAFVAERVRRATPRAALLSTLAGIALGFISLGFFFRSFARPIVGFTTLGIVMLVYFGRVKFKGNLPGGMVAVLLGTIHAWWTGIAPVGASPPAPSFHLPIPVLSDIFAALGSGNLFAYISIIIPMGLFNVLGSLQNIESAEAAGDSYAMRPSLAVNGIGSLLAALSGSGFPTTIYIRHPGWKATGARAGSPGRPIGQRTRGRSPGGCGRGGSTPGRRPGAGGTRPWRRWRSSSVTESAPAGGRTDGSCWAGCSSPRRRTSRS